MPRTEWTPATDATIIAMRADGATWDAIAAVFGVCRWTAICRGARLGLARTVNRAEPPLEVADVLELNLEREPLPAGHHETWGAIIAGTCIAGTAYPHPVFA